jgi:hypothetical protein
MKKFLQKLFLAACCVGAGAMTLSLSSCDNKPETIAGRTYEYQCLWDGGPNDFSPRGTFNEGGTITHTDDTATLSGTWSSVEETVVWTLSNPPKNTRFRGTFDKNGISGNISDDLGRTGIFQGARK